MTSLRARLMAWLIGLLTVVGLLAGLLAYWLDREEVDEALDARVAAYAEAFGRLIKTRGWSELDEA